jgi:hypothetical protein
VATGVAQNPPSYSCEGGNFSFTDGGGNSGIAATQCGPTNPAPVFPPYPATGVQAQPGALNFGSVATGATSAANTVTVTNPTGSAAAVSSIATGGDFAQTNNCGSSIAANGSCTVSVTFKPTATGNRTGSLTVNAGGVTNTVSLSGTGTAPGPVLNTNPANLSFASAVVGSTAAAQTVTVTNSGTASATVSNVAVTGDFSQTNNCGTVAVGASCAATVSFKPTAGGSRSGTLTITSNANNSPTTVALDGSGIDSTTNIAAGTPASASSTNGTFAASNITDPDPSTYWESANGAFPQWAQVNLGQNFSIGKVVLKLPPSTAWGARTQTLSVQGSTDGTNFSTIVGSANYTFDPNTNNNTVAITFNATTAWWVRVNITANTGWPAGQLSDLEVFPSGGSSTPSPTLSAGPSSLSFASQALNTNSGTQTVTVTNTGGAAAVVTSIGITGDFAQTNTCGGSVAAGASCAVTVTFRPTASGTRTGSLTVNSNASNSPTTVALTGTGAGSTNTNLAAGKVTSQSSNTQNLTSSAVTDGNQSSYWESANNAFPQWVQVDLGSAQSAGRVVLQLPTTWGARNETLSLLGSTDGSNFSTITPSATYTFDPNINNTVTITFPSTTQRFFRVNITANTGWPAGQVSEFQIWNN